MLRASSGGSIPDYVVHVSEANAVARHSRMAIEAALLAEFTRSPWTSRGLVIVIWMSLITFAKSPRVLSYSSQATRK